MIAHVTQCISQLEYNIENMVNTSKANVALNIIDVSGPIEQENILLQSFESIPGVIRVRSLL